MSFWKRVVGIHDELMITDNLGVSPELAHDTVKFADGQGFNDPSFEHRTQRSGILVNLTGTQLPLVVEERHPGCGAGAAR